MPLTATEPVKDSISGGEWHKGDSGDQSSEGVAWEGQVQL